MNEEKINRALALALGLERKIDDTEWPRTKDRWLFPGGFVKTFSPSTSLDDLAAYVLPEIIKRGLWEDFKISLSMFGVATDARLIMGKPASIAAAALDVLGRNAGGRS